MLRRGASRAAAPEHELMRLLAGTAAARDAASERIARLAALADGERLAGAAAAQSLLPLVASRLERAAPDRVPDVVRDRAASLVRETRHWSVAVEVMTERLATALERSGVPAIALKGPVMARELYGDPGLRVTSDIDLLVPRNEFRRALTVLSHEGYVPETNYDWAGGLPLFEATLHPTAAWAPSIDLHWRLHWSEDGLSEDALARSRPPQPGRPRLLAALDLLAALYVMYARDGFWGLRGAADIAAWWDRHGDAMPAGGLDGIVRDHPALADGIVAAALVAERLTGVPASTTVPGRRLRHRAASRAVRLANWNGSVSPSRLSATRALADVLVSPPGSRRAAVARQAWPPATVVAAIHGRWLRRGVPLPALRLYYACRVVARQAPVQLALLWRSRNGRELSPVQG